MVPALVGLGISIYYYSDRPPSASISLVPPPILPLPLPGRRSRVDAGSGSCTTEVTPQRQKPCPVMVCFAPMAVVPGRVAVARKQTFGQVRLKCQIC